MPSTFPSALTSYTNPQATDKLNAPSHAGIETNQNSGISQVEAVIGLEGAASTIGTIQYDLRSPASNGGGHVQTANKGGTGQTSYNIGDMLVATSSSVLDKLAVGGTNQYLVADASQSSGMKWGSANRVATRASVINIIGTTAETSILGITIPASILGNNNAVRATIYVSQYFVGEAADTLLLRANYGNNTIGSILLTPSGASTNSVAGKIEYTLLANSATQRGIVSVNLKADRLNVLQSSVQGIDAFKMGTSSVNTMANQSFGMTAQWSQTVNGTELAIGGYVVEKIL